MGHSRSHEADARSTELQRQPETLTLTDRNIDAECTRRA
jgi:hypothetical protein